MAQFEETQQCPLLKETLILFDESGKTPHQLATETGLPFYWLRDLKAGRSKGPSVNRIQYLYEYLSKKQLKV